MSGSLGVRPTGEAADPDLASAGAELGETTRAPALPGPSFSNGEFELYVHQ
ncbi:hypothetical protein QWJ41_12195 [Nocardioides sp. SOB44]|jgi:hypothetical protein|uniref:Uncharacterized protein n=1 Tax=Nocardioides cremeus TaxID=3058044 RepID=A0ABT8TR96_9ACTN|nr:hypothetical protein [Nocardioides cremeus]MDO3396485.1 hypothetical protein [Nocardioides cremeus]